jgi:MSHA biogenesis protein MshJ
VKEQLARLAVRIDALSLRERGLVFFGVIVALYMAWDAALMQPLDARKEVTTQRMATLQREIGAIDQQIGEVVSRQQADPNAELRRQMQPIEQRLQALEGRIGDAMAGLVAPQEMARVIEAVLQHHSGLHPIRVESLGSVPLLEKPGPDAAAMLYRHRMQIELRGSYLDTVKFLRAVQELPWSFYWDGVVVESEEYPQTRIVVTISTLSLKEGWIGV